MTEFDKSSHTIVDNSDKMKTKEKINRVFVPTHLVDQSEDLLAAQTSKGLIEAVKEKISPGIYEKSENPEDLFASVQTYIDDTLEGEVEAYITTTDISYIWGIPKQLMFLFKYSRKLCSIQKLGSVYLWEDLIDCLGDKPVRNSKLIVKGTKLDIETNDFCGQQHILEETDGLCFSVFISKKDVFKMLDRTPSSALVDYYHDWLYEPPVNEWYPWDIFQYLVKRLEPKMINEQLFDRYSKMYTNLVYANSID